MCEVHIAPDGTRMIVCGGHARSGRRHKCLCGASASLQCDWKIGNGRTCDRYICARCALEVGPDKHLCAEHQTAYHAWAANRQLRAGE